MFLQCHHKSFLNMLEPDRAKFSALNFLCLWWRGGQIVYWACKLLTTSTHPTNYTPDTSAPKQRPHSQLIQIPDECSMSRVLFLFYNSSLTLWVPQAYVCHTFVSAFPASCLSFKNQAAFFSCRWLHRHTLICMSTPLLLLPYFAIRWRRINHNFINPCQKTITYLICGIAVPNNEFAILRGTDQEPTQMRTAF